MAEKRVRTFAEELRGNPPRISPLLGKQPATGSSQQNQGNSSTGNGTAQPVGADSGKSTNTNSSE